MRFLYFGDKHERRTTPENRLDDFLETQKTKTREIIELGRKYGVSAFLQPGDFFDSPNPGYDFVSSVAGMWGGHEANDLLAKFRSGQLRETDVLKAIKHYIPMIGVAGNHELYGNNIHTLNKTAIGLLNKWGLMRFATKDNPSFFYTDDGLTIAITGTHYHLDIDTPEHLDDYIVEEKLGDYHIHIVHGMLSDKNMGKYIRHTLIDQIKHTKADLTISGHDHIGFPLTEIDGKYFVNTGSIPRLSNDLKEMNRKPKVLLIDITKEHGMRFKEIYLKSALPGEMVLDRKKIEERKKRQNRLEDYKKAVKDAGVKRSTDIMEIIRDLSETKQVSKEIKEDLLNRVGNKKAEMIGETDNIIEKFHVIKIILENFQSHVYTELSFKDGFNILVGESGQGKSSVLRAFNWVYENKPTGKSIIRRGADYARVTIYLSNGYVISRYIEAKRSGKNGYEITDPKTGSVEFHNTKILPEIQKLIGFNQLIIDKDLQFNLNFMKQGTGWFLIGDNYPATQKAKILGSIYGVQYADAVVREFDQEERKVNDAIKKSKEDLMRINKKIGQYDYLEQIEEVIQKAEILFQEIEELQKRKEQITELIEKRRRQQAIIQENEEILQSLQPLPQIKEKLLQIKEDERQRNQLEKLILTRKDLSSKLDMAIEAIQKTEQVERAKRGWKMTQDLLKQKEAIEEKVAKRKDILIHIQEETSILQQTEHLPTMKQSWNAIQELVTERKKVAEQLERAKQIEKKREKNLYSLQAIQETLEKTKAIEQARKLFAEMQQLITRKEEIQKALITHKRYQEMVKKEQREIQKQSQCIKEYAEHYKHLLEQEGTCPTCFGTIDANTAHRIVSKYH